MGSTCSRSSTPPFGLFECPYVRDGLESSAEHNQQVCPFAHKQSSSWWCFAKSLIPVPKFVCTEYLFGRCTKSVYVLSLVVSGNQVTTCTDGVHPQLDHDLKRNLQDTTTVLFYELHERMQLSWSSYIKFLVQDAECSCRICLEPLGTSSPGQFGLLRDCPHLFCGHCLAQWTRAQPQGGARCPTCRRDYAGFVIWPLVGISQEEKVKLYELQNLAPREPVHNDTPNWGIWLEVPTPTFVPRSPTPERAVRPVHIPTPAPTPLRRRHLYRSPTPRSRSPPTIRLSPSPSPSLRMVAPSPPSVYLTPVTSQSPRASSL